MAKSVEIEKKDSPYKVEWQGEAGYVSGIGQVEPGMEFQVPGRISYERAKELEGQKLIKRSGE